MTETTSDRTKRPSLPSRLLMRTVGEMMGPDRRTVRDIALRERRAVSTIYDRLRRAEQTLGVRLQPMSNRGRPRKAAQQTSFTKAGSLPGDVGTPEAPAAC